MSQFFWNATLDGEPVEVLAGWDEPMQTYFVTVFDEDEEAIRVEPTLGIYWSHPGTVTYWLESVRIRYPSCLDEKLMTEHGSTTEFLELDG